MSKICSTLRSQSDLIHVDRFKSKSHQPAVFVPVVTTYTYGPTTSDEINVELDYQYADIMFKNNNEAGIFWPKNLILN